MNTDLQVSAIICTHNPRASFLNRVVAALSAQTLPRDYWELILVDSGSTPPIESRGDLVFPAEMRVVRVERPGLALARRAGAEAARAPLLAQLDDDTVVTPEYLANAVAFMNRHPQVGCCGGKFAAEFETPPPPWLKTFEMLGIRDFGHEEIVVPGLQPGVKPAEFPEIAPIGVCVTRRQAYESYVGRWSDDPRHASLGRTGGSLVSGEDNDYALCCLEAGWGLAYVPSLEMLHLMPAGRLDPRYLARLNRASSRSWVRVLDLHGLRPWPAIAPWTLPLRVAKAWLAHRAWKGPEQSIRWHGARGKFEGQAELTRN